MTALATNPELKNPPEPAPVDPAPMVDRDAFVDPAHPQSWSRQMNALASAGHYREAYELAAQKCNYVENQVQYFLKFLAGEENHWSIMHARLAEMVDDGRPQRILDVGCAAGSHAIQFAREGHQAWGIDILPGLIRRGRELTDALKLSERVHLVEGDIRRLDTHFERSFFDSAVACNIFEHLDDLSLMAVLHALKQVVRPGGKIIIETSPGRHYYWFEPERAKLLALLAPFAWLPDRLFSAYVRGLDRFFFQGLRHEPPSFYRHEPGHINCMDPIHLRGLLKRAGLQDIRTFAIHAHPGKKDEGCMRSTWTRRLFGHRSIACRNVFGTAIVPAEANR